MRKIPFLVESKNGHDEFEVPESKVQEEVSKQLKDDKWVTLEKKDGSSEILTKKDLPQENKPDWKNTFGVDNSNNVKVTSLPKSPLPQKAKDFAKSFEHVKSVTSTMKAKGG